MTSGGRVLRRSDKLRSCGVSDGYTIQVTSRMRGGGRHKDKKSKAEKKQVTRQEPVSNEGPAVLESEKDAVIRMMEETEGYREIIKSISEANDEEHGMQCFKAELHEKSGLDEEQIKVLECGVSWVEARITGWSAEKEKTLEPSKGGRKSKSKGGRKSKSKAGRTSKSKGGRTSKTKGGRTSKTKGGRKSKTKGGRKSKTKGGRKSKSNGGRKSKSNGGRKSKSERRQEEQEQEAAGRARAKGGRKSKSKSKGGRTSKSRGGRKSKSKPLGRSEARKCISEKRNSRNRRERRAQTSRR